jgi:DNA-binding beta-propeller fold protein YncE
MSVTGDKAGYIKKTVSTLLTAIVFWGCASSVPVKKEADEAVPEVESLHDAGPVAPDKEPVFYPMPPAQPRLQFLTTITAGDEREYKVFPVTARNFLAIKRPYDIGAVRGRIYISDRKFNKVLVADLEKKELDVISGPYESAGIWITEDGYKYVADFKNKQVVVFDGSNRITKIYTNPALFEKPVDVAAFLNRVYVCDINRHQIFVIDKESGESIQEIGGIGTEDGKFYKPTHVISDKEGNIYVNDFFNLRVQKFDPDGNFLKAFGHPGDTLGAFARPKGIGIDRDGHLYAVDAAFENVQIFDDSTTDLLLFFGEFGLDPGNMYLPNALYIDYDNVEYFKEFADKNFDVEYLVYVGNTWGPVRLNVYGFGSWSGRPLSEAEDTTGESNEIEK